MTELESLRMPTYNQFQVIFSIFKGKQWLLALCSAVFLSSVGLGLTVPVVSLYASSFGVSATFIGLLFTAFAAGRILITIPSGRLADRWGRKVLMIGGMLVISVSALGQASAGGYMPLLFFRLIQGIGSAMFMSVSFLVVADLTPPAERGRVTSVFQGSIMIGLAVSPALGGGLAHQFGLNAPFYCYSILAFLIAIFVWRFLPESYGKIAEIDSDQSTSDKTIKIQSPFRELLKDRNFILISIAAILIFVGRAGARDTLLPLLGTEILGLTPVSLGVIFTIIQIFNLLAIPFAGFISDRIGRKPAIVSGLGIQGLGMVLTGTANFYPGFLFGALFMGAGKGLGETSSVVYVTDISPAGKYGTTYGLFLTLRDMGLLIGPPVLGWIAHNYGLRPSMVLNGVGMFVVMLVFALFANETIPFRSGKRNDINGY